MVPWRRSHYTWLALVGGATWVTLTLPLANGVEWGHAPVRLILLIIALALTAQS